MAPGRERRRRQRQAEPIQPDPPARSEVHHDNAVGAVEPETASEAELIEATMDTAKPTEFATEEPPVMGMTPRELMQMLEDLQPRIKELESVLATRVQAGDSGREAQAEATNDVADIIATIRNLQHRNATADRLVQSLGIELAETKRRLTEAQSVRVTMEARAERSERECARFEREQGPAVRRLKEVTSQLELISEERDRLAEQRASDERHIGELDRCLMDVKSQLSRLGETAAELGRLNKALSEATKALAAAREESHALKENVQSLKSKLDAVEVSKNSLELELATNRGLICGQNEQIEELAENLQTAHAELATVRAALTRHEVDSKKLVESNERAGREVKTLKARIETLQGELDMTTQALREIRTATLSVTGRILEHGLGGVSPVDGER